MYPVFYVLKLCFGAVKPSKGMMFQFIINEAIKIYFLILAVTYSNFYSSFIYVVLSGSDSLMHMMGKSQNFFGLLTYILLFIFFINDIKDNLKL